MSQRHHSNLKNIISLTLVIVLLVLSAIGWYWSQEPDLKPIATDRNKPLVIGSTTTQALVDIINTLLDKPGGYLRNDMLMPPSIFLDNMPNWEYGALIQARDMSRALRNDFSRSQTQSTEDQALRESESKLNVDDQAWMFPAAETEYRQSATTLEDYLDRLSDTDSPDAQFYARADNLNAWLSLVEKRLGSLSQRLSASVGKPRLNTDLAGDTAAAQSTAGKMEVMSKTPWLEIDNVYYEARGATWALIQLLRAVEVDFKYVLEKKNATVSLKQIIRELEGTQESLWSPVVLNGSGFGIFSNHSLVMASYISRANAAVIELRSLLADG
ncbi:conserved hypothetical protein [gamma proteobacterium HTCC5015]|nr:conserved hypothetical protein [gamma proteobacterium HTCC5015]